MALSSHHLAVGLAGIALGGYKTAVEDFHKANGVNAAADAILSISALNPVFLGRPVYNNEKFAEALTASFLGSTSEAVQAGVSKIVVDFMAANATYTRGQVSVAFMDALLAIPANDPVLGASRKAFEAKVAKSETYTGTSTDLTVLAGELGSASSLVVQTLTTGIDNLVGTALNDTFVARTIDNKNTLQDGDKIDGGAGIDTIYADFTSASNAITPVLMNIENVVIRAQTTTSDPTNGTNMYNGTVQIDAQRSLAVDYADNVTAATGVTRWESNNSRSDVIIEDVRIGNSQKTSDVTIAMVDTSAGNVDFGVYFDQLSLRNSSTSTSSLSLELLDTRSMAAGTGPLKDNPYDSFAFYLNGKAMVIKSAAIDAALTYADLLTAIQGAIVAARATTPELATVNATLGSTFERFDTVSGTKVTGTSIVLTDTAGGVVTLHPTTGWATPTGTVPASSGLHTNIIPGTSSSVAELVTSKIVLDNVGRGSTGGDLVVGGMSTGETSTSRGVERFEITVEDNSKLQTINSTNNALREVIIVNGATSETVVNAYTTTVKDEGDLTVNGNVNAGNTANGSTGIGSGDDTILAGVNDLSNVNSYSADHHAAFGFTDVRLIDASAFKGKLAFTAQITSDSISKYINQMDTAANPAADVAGTGNVNFNVKGANFIYTGGNDNDTMAVTIDASAAASRSTIVSGQSDFTFNFDGGAGNDTLTINLDSTSTGTGRAENWYNNQNLNNNITITGGAGDDVIRKPGAGDTTITGDAGNDLIFTENSGNKAKWVFNTTDQTNIDVVAFTARNINDLRSDVNTTYNLYKSTVTVTFKGIASADITVSGTGYQTTNLEINQAIKNAINTDATLKNLLVAKDGPANTLIVESLIDGAMTTGSLGVAFASPKTGALTTPEIAAAAAAYGLAVGSTEAQVIAAMDTARTLVGTNADYNTVMATTGTTNITGSNSVETSDNVVTGGTDNDLIVLGTAADATYSPDNLGLSSNEVLTYAAGFGNDVVVNFAATGAGIDHFDMSAFLGGAAAGVVNTLVNTDKNVTIITETTANDTAAEIAALVNVLANTAAKKQVYIAVTAHNVGKVYSVVDGTAAADAVVTLEGSIDLADTVWSTLNLANFTVPTVIAEGPNTLSYNLTATADGQTLIGAQYGDRLFTGGFDTVTLTGAGDSDVFAIEANADGAVITDLATGDVFTVAGGDDGAVVDLTATTAAFVATAATSNAIAGTVVLTGAAAGSTINMAAATGAGGYTLNGAAGVDNLTGSANADIITGGAGADVISGGAGVDSITGGTGADALTGGAGADTFAFGTDGSVAGTSMDAISDFNTGGSDILTFGGNTTVLAADATALVAGSAAGSNVQTSAGGLVTFAVADNTLALKLAAVQADTQLDAAGSIAYFVDGANGYVYYAGAATGNADDQLIELTGVITLTTITGGATTILA